MQVNENFIVLSIIDVKKTIPELDKKSKLNGGYVSATDGIKMIMHNQTIINNKLNKILTKI